MTGTQIDNIENYFWKLLEGGDRSIVFNAKSCISVLEDISFENSLNLLVTPHVCDTRKPPTIHITYQKYHYQLYLSIQEDKDIYICFNYLEGDSCWKEYLNLDNLATSEKLKEVLKYFTLENDFVIPPAY